MSGKKKTGKRGEHRVKRMVNLISQMPKSEIKEAVKRAEAAEAKQRDGGKSQPASQGTPQGTPANAAARAAAQGAQGEPAFEPRGGDRHAAERQRLAQDAARAGLQVPIDMQPSDSSRFASAEETKRRRAAEAKRGPSKRERDAERRYQQRRREAGLPPSGVGGAPVMPGSGGSFVG